MKELSVLAQHAGQECNRSVTTEQAFRPVGAWWEHRLLLPQPKSGVSSVLAGQGKRRGRATQRLRSLLCLPDYAFQRRRSALLLSPTRPPGQQIHGAKVLVRGAGGIRTHDRGFAGPRLSPLGYGAGDRFSQTSPERAPVNLRSPVLCRPPTTGTFGHLFRRILGIRGAPSTLG